MPVERKEARIEIHGEAIGTHGSAYTRAKLSGNGIGLLIRQGRQVIDR